MTSEVRNAWGALERAHGRVEGAMAVMGTLKQPELAEARKIVIGYIEDAGEAFAALERAWMASEEGLPSNAKKLNQSFWTWAMTTLQVVQA